jgi:hypothetical protein
MDPKREDGIDLLYESPFVYARGNPINHVDPSGSQPVPPPPARPTLPGNPPKPGSQTLVRICCQKITLTGTVYRHLQTSFKCGNRTLCYEGNPSGFSKEDKDQRTADGIYKDCCDPKHPEKFQTLAGQLVANKCTAPALPEAPISDAQCITFRSAGDCNEIDRCMTTVKDAINTKCCYAYIGRGHGHTSNSVAYWLAQYCLHPDATTRGEIVKWIDKNCRTGEMPGFPPTDLKPECLEALKRAK